MRCSNVGTILAAVFTLLIISYLLQKSCVYRQINGHLNEELLLSTFVNFPHLALAFAVLEFMSYVIIGILGICVFCLCYGVMKRKPGYLLPWMCTFLLICVIGIIVISFCPLPVTNDMISMEIVSVVLWLCVFGYYQEIKMEANL